MPRKNPLPIAVAPLAQLVAPPPPSPIIQTLRRDWRWAAISQFIWTFSDAFGLVDWDIENLESDFDGDEQAVIPMLIAKLLFALTYNRQINRSNAFENLRKQCALRKPNEKCALGTIEEPVEWATLGLGQKVGFLHELCEWQLEDPARFRGLLKSEEDAVSWRVEPVGWDKTGNTYWLFDDNRLWIQRPIPLPPRPAKKTAQKSKKSAKKARPSTSTSTPAPRKSHKKKEWTPVLTPSPEPEPQHEDAPVSGSRRRNPVTFYGNPTPTGQALKRGIAITPASSKPSGSTSRPTRSSARHAPNGHAEPIESPTKASKSTPTSLPLGTRVSRRLRNVEDEWQQVPEEWLSTPARAQKKKAQKAKKSRNADEESELSELTDEEEHERLLLSSGPLVNAQTAEQVAEQTKEVDKNEKDDEMDVDQVPLLAPSPAPATDGTLAEEVTESEVQNGAENINAEVVFEQAEEAKAATPQTDDCEAETAPAKTEADHSDVVAEAELVVEKEVEDRTLPNGQPEESAERANGDSSVTAPVEAVHAKVDEEDHAKVEPEETADVKPAAEEEKEDTSHIPADFVEWEAICVTLYDWRTFPEQFAASKDADEQALYHMLTEEVGPTIIEVLVGKEEERIKQELVNNRKRSSRIATKEFEREEALRREAAEREMEDRMERIRAEELRKAREEAEVLAREQARDERLREREERAAAREEAALKKAEEEQREKEKKERRREKRKRRREGEEVSDDSEDEDATRRRGTTFGDDTATATGTGTGSPQERWELSCEVCKKSGWNLDEDEDLVSCDDCGRWQHVECHDRLDVREGRGKRNWDQEDFKCKECLHREARKRQRLENPTQANGHHHPPPQHPLAQVHTAYPVLPGSAPGPPPPLDPVRPPPPPLNPGEFYLPYPHPPAREERPAGYAVYYPPGQQTAQPQLSMSPEARAYQGGPPASAAHASHQGNPGPSQSSAYARPQQAYPQTHQSQVPPQTSQYHPHSQYPATPQSHQQPHGSRPDGPSPPQPRVQSQAEHRQNHVPAYPSTGQTAPQTSAYGHAYGQQRISPQRASGYPAQAPPAPAQYAQARQAALYPPTQPSQTSPHHSAPRPSHPSQTPTSQISPSRVAQQGHAHAHEGINGYAGNHSHPLPLSAQAPARPDPTLPSVAR